MSFRSRHPGGVHFCLADGSVRFLRDSIAHNLYRALSTKNGREAVTPP
jgi:prepilin-type processing-associated H-X9-DG protein